MWRFSGAVLILIVLNTASFAQVVDWQFKGPTTWQHPADTSHRVIWSETSVNEDVLAVFREVATGNWYISFRYHGDRKLEKGNAEFFLRTQDIADGGRFGSDYVFENDPVVYPNHSGGPQTVLAKLSASDLAALSESKGYEIGVGYNTQQSGF